MVIFFIFFCSLEEYTLDNIYGKNCVSGYIIYCFRAQTKKVCFLSRNDHIYIYICITTVGNMKLIKKSGVLPSFH